MFRSVITTLFFWLVLSCTQSTSADVVRVAAASNFTAPIRDIAKAFEDTSDHTIILSFGSSGKFFAQIHHGAPFDVFLSADQEKPLKLEEDGNGAKGTRFTYALGKIALWSANPDMITDGAAVLRQTDAYQKIALANPRVAPYGTASVEILTSLEIEDATRNKWVMGENISQTYQFIATGGAELGFIALSQVDPEMGSHWVVPDSLYSPIYQDAILLNRAESNPAAREFLLFLQSETAKSIIKTYGYGVPQSILTPALSELE